MAHAVDPAVSSSSTFQDPLIIPQNLTCPESTPKGVFSSTFREKFRFPESYFLHRIQGCLALQSETLSQNGEADTGVNTQARAEAEDAQINWSPSWVE